MRRPIAISLSPNSQGDDVRLAFSLLLFPWRLGQGNYVKLLERWFCQYFKISHAISFASGRGALFATLKALGIGKGDEVLLQAFTCVAVPNAVLWTGAKPVYVDITSELTIDPIDAEQKISKKTKAVIVQHTFGIPSDMDAMQQIAEKYNIVVIEDCAHTIGGSYNNKKLGLFGSASIFSFGRDKAFSSVFGGVVITNDKALGEKIRLQQKNAGHPPLFWTLQQLIHPVAFFLILPLYNFLSLGKIILIVLQKLHLLSFPVLKQEKEGKKVSVFTKRMPNALARLAYKQVQKLHEFNTKRESFVRFYLSMLKDVSVDMPYETVSPLLRFPILCYKRDEMIKYLKKQGIYVGNWYAHIIDPMGVYSEKIFYRVGSCPNAVSIAKKILNLPTYPTMDIFDAQKVVEKILKYVSD